MNRSQSTSGFYLSQVWSFKINLIITEIGNKILNEYKIKIAHKTSIINRQKTRNKHSNKKQTIKMCLTWVLLITHH